MNHLEGDQICTIALHLNENVYGAGGDLTEPEIRQRLIRDIHDETGFMHKDSGLIPIEAVAALILDVWKYMDRALVDEMIRDRDAPLPSLAEGGSEDPLETFFYRKHPS